MKNRSVLFSALLSLVIPASASLNLEQVLFRLEQKEKTFESIRFDFKQEVSFSAMDTNAVVRGNAVFSTMGKWRVEKQSPDQQLTVSDGKKVWIYNASNAQVWESSTKDWFGGSLLPKGLVPVQNYVEDLKNNFELKLGSSEETNQQVEILAEPKNKNLGYHLKLLVSTESWLPVKTVYSSDSGKVETTLSGQELNPNVKDSDFKFVPSKGIEVIPLN